jgi:hypothetical protein
MGRPFGAGRAGVGQQPAPLEVGHVGVHPAVMPLEEGVQPGLGLRAKRVAVELGPVLGARHPQHLAQQHGLARDARLAVHVLPDVRRQLYAVPQAQHDLLPGGGVGAVAGPGEEPRAYLPARGRCQRREARAVGTRALACS